MAIKQKVRIGDLLVKNGVITEDQLQQALAKQKSTGLRLGRTLINLGFVQEDRFLGFLSEQLNVPFVDLRRYKFDNAIVQRLSETHARRFRAIALSEKNGLLLVGMADPTDIYAFDALERLLQQPIELAVVRESELLATLDLVYRRTDEIAGFAEELDEELTDGQFDLAALVPAADDSDAPVVKLLQSLFEDAVQIRASDIHIEPDEHVLRIRQRIDGVLQEQIVKERRIAPALVLRLKLMSGLDISEKRLPQDGRFSLKVKEKKIDVRLSTMPVEYGESVVMRLLDQTDGAVELDEVGMSPQMVEQFRKLIHMPHGLILVTGPTGSGKTTTLYGALQELNEIGKKIITVEDPVEYRLSRVNQVQINPKIGLTFARVLRASLRQDPDILLVGEIRDQETAEIALRAAMTGHMVLSTLHTNDAVSSAMRLVDMGAEGFLAATAIRAVLAQRLVRRLCDNCCVDHQPEQREIQWIRHVLGELAPDEFQLKRASGCHRCNNTGYRGRVGVFELLVLNDEMADALRRANSSDFVKAARQSKGYRPLVVSALLDAFAGVTSLEEVYKVAEQLDESGDWMLQNSPSWPSISDEADAIIDPDVAGDTEASHLMAWDETER
ncbi:GspE/PulE family protein [Pseudohongiella spirulinae]|uniref:Type II secretion system protein E n=1 Tax=Pseudohongiella spirulinae TaxID=1249552 RepID=A0A0S2KAE6_9GAMM|nr:GspE/PulE family protein [Pseudohongiella spirulinae]ALO45161.1 Type II secretion system protein E [Pseudohongiella spirulinae]